MRLTIEDIGTSIPSTVPFLINGAPDNNSLATSPAFFNATGTLYTDYIPGATTLNGINLGIPDDIDQLNIRCVPTMGAQEVIAIPLAPGSISGLVTSCAGVTGQIYSIVAVPNATTYTWTVPAGWSITAGQGTISITVTTGATSGVISVTAANNCGTSAASTMNVGVNSINAGTVGSDQTICAGGNPAAFTTITAASGSGSLTYQWRSNTTGCGGVFTNIALNGNGATYDPPAGLSQTTYYQLVVTSTLGGSSCSAVSNCITVTVNPLPSTSAIYHF